MLSQTMSIITRKFRPPAELLARRCSFSYIVNVKSKRSVAFSGVTSVRFSKSTVLLLLSPIIDPFVFKGVKLGVLTLLYTIQIFSVESRWLSELLSRRSSNSPRQICKAKISKQSKYRYMKQFPEGLFLFVLF